MLRDKNVEYDLTRIYQFDNIVQKHYIDCILVAKLLNWRLPSPVLDIGTGAGFPGIPLKIASPETDRKSTRLNSSHIPLSRMPSSA